MTNTLEARRAAMATQTNLYIARCKTCKTATRVGIPALDDYGHLFHGLGCIACHRNLRVFKMTLTLDESRDCNDRCRNATGKTCACACGGEEHGATWDGIYIAS